MNTNAKKWFWALVIAQAVFLLGWAGYHEYVRQSSPVILLKGRPVDPQDLLRGDFMTLNYDISTMKLPPGTAAGSGVWVLLEKKGAYFEAVAVSAGQPAPGRGQVLVRGEADYGWGSSQAPSLVHYGIEKYFVPEGKGTPRFKLLEVEVSVSPAHRLYIKRVLLDGKAFP
jgi:uncharacterized membrane-anchored protein